MARHYYSRRTRRRLTPALLIVGAIVATALLANIVPRVVSLFGISTASADEFDPPVRTELVRTVGARATAERDGSCTAHSAFVPRADAWACTVADQVYDPCFEVHDPDKPTAIVCGADSASGATGFAIRNVVPIGLRSDALPLDPAALATLPVTIDLIGAPVTLVNGQFYAPNVEKTGGSVLVAQSGLRADGDLDEDGDLDSAGLLVADAGDGRMFIYLYAVRNDNGASTFAGSIELGDRVKVDALEISNGQIVVAMTTHSDEDPACCPTLGVNYAFNLVNGSQIVQDTDGWRLELQGGVQCRPVTAQAAEGAGPYAYQCSNGVWLQNGLIPGRVWYGRTLSAADASETPRTLFEPIVRLWQ